MDRLNALSYAYHYRNIDSVEYYASAAKGTAEGLNNLAFVKMVRMDYKAAEDYLNQIPEMTDNQLELLVCYVQQMRLCQRRSRNKDFHDFRERAVTCMKRIDEERNQLDVRQQQRLRYAETEFGIVNSTYYYYVGLERQSIDALMAIDPNEVRRDTAQFLNYLYNMGAGGIITDGSQEDIYQEEMDCLSRCLNIALRHDYPYFEAQAKEALADHTGDLELAEEALQLFENYGDIYQIAGAHRTLASCYHAIGDDEMALEHLNKALSDTTINQAPDLVASIREQLSVAYAALNDKAASDYNRNLYLDLQEQTRQDRELESRAAHYDKASEQLNWMLIAVVCAIVLLLFLLWLFNYLNHRSKDGNELDDVLEQKSEDLRMRQLSVEQSERRNLDQRAKVSVVVGILPLIDRIRHTIDHLPLNIDHSAAQKDPSANNGQSSMVNGQSPNPKVVYFPSCINQTMGQSKQGKKIHALVDEVIQLMAKAGYEVIFPEGMDRMCCGQIWESKGMLDIADRKSAELEAALWKASEQGKYSVLCAQSPCLHRMRKVMKKMKLYEPAEFIMEYLVPRLDFHPTDKPIALHLTCSTRQMGVDKDMVALAKLCSTNVFIPEGVGCCGFAGDRGFTFPELNKYGLRKLRPQIEEHHIEVGYSNSRTCEIGLETNTGIPYMSIVYLVNECTTPKR